MLSPGVTSQTTKTNSSWAAVAYELSIQMKGGGVLHASCSGTTSALKIPFQEQEKIDKTGRERTGQ